MILNKYKTLKELMNELLVDIDNIEEAVTGTKREFLSPPVKGCKDK